MTAGIGPDVGPGIGPEDHRSSKRWESASR